jgi:hypothetical protein
LFEVRVALELRTNAGVIEIEPPDVVTLERDKLPAL